MSSLLEPLFWTQGQDYHSQQIRPKLLDLTRRLLQHFATLRPETVKYNIDKTVKSTLFMHRR